VLKRSERHYLIILGILAISAITVSLLAHWVPLFPHDLQIILFLQSFANPLLTSIMVWTSNLFTSWPAALMVTGIGLLIGWRLGRKEGILIWVAGLISVINQAFKILINRPRPSPEQVQIIGINHGNGYPSGHTFFATIILGIIAYLLFTHLKQKNLRILSLILIILIILLVGTSRIYLGAHWPSDVLGGYIFGGLFLTLLIWSSRWWKKRSQIKNTG
jgi:undecaprenyl-diphosphatase